MRKVGISGTEMEASVLALGSAQFGSGLTREESFRQMDRYLSLGGNILDTAHAYGTWIPGGRSLSEMTIGEWIHTSGKRHQILLATKGGHPEMSNPEAKRVNPQALEKDLEESLRLLQTDYIDLYFLHRDDPSVPEENLLEWLNQKVKEGTIRAFGCSNWGLSRIQSAQEKAAQQQLAGFSCNQAMGCLADVHPETLPPSNVVMDAPMRAYHEQTQMTFMAYMSVARGYLYKKRHQLSINEESHANYDCPSNDRIVDRLKELEGEGYSVLDFTYQYLMQMPFPLIAVSGFHDGKQMEEAVASTECEIPPDLMRSVRELKELQ